MAGRPSREVIYARLTEALTELRQDMGGLPSPSVAEGIWTTIWYEEARHSGRRIPDLTDSELAELDGLLRPAVAAILTLFEPREEK